MSSPPTRPKRRGCCSPPCEQAFVNLRTGRPGQLPPPLPGMQSSLEPRIADMLERVLRCAIVGGPAEIAAGLEQFHCRPPAR